MLRLRWSLMCLSCLLVLAAALSTTATEAAKIDKHRTFSDALHKTKLDPKIWRVDMLGGAVGSAEPQRDGLHLRLSASNSSNWFSVRPRFLPTIVGDFDAAVGYRLQTWPTENGTRITMGSGQIGAVERVSWGQGDSYTHGEFYLTDFIFVGQGVSGTVATTDTVGRLRLTRIGSTYAGYRWDGTQWVLVNSYAGPPTGTITDFFFEISSPGYAWAGKDVEVVFENFEITGSSAR